MWIVYWDDTDMRVSQLLYCDFSWNLELFLSNITLHFYFFIFCFLQGMSRAEAYLKQQLGERAENLHEKRRQREREHSESMKR